MVYIFCLSYLSVPAILSLVKEKMDFIVITEQEPIAIFFSQLFPAGNVCLIPSIPVYKGIKKILTPFLLTDYKRKLMKHLGAPKGTEIYFFHNAFGVNVNWWLLKVRKENIILYKPDIDISTWPVRYNPKFLMNSFWNWLNFSTWTPSVWNGRVLIPKVGNHFLRKIHARGVQITIDQEYIISEISRKLAIDFGKYPYLLLGGNMVIDHIIEEGEYIKKNDLLIEMLGRDKVIIKEHPRYKFLYSLERDCANMPSFLPANIMLSSFDAIISYTSSVLFEAANIGKLSISLLEYFEPIMEERKEQYSLYLTSNLDKGAIIYFPRTTEEIINLIKKHNHEVVY